MDFWQTIRLIGRRWYVVVPLLLVTVLAAQTARQGVEPSYTVTANATILPPSQANIQTDTGEVQVVPVNPYLSFTGSTQTTATALSVIAVSPEFRTTLTGDARFAAYAVTVPARNPILQVSVESKDQRAAIRAAGGILDGLRRELDRRQGSAPPTQRLSLSILSEPAVAGVDNARLRAAVVTGIIGVLATAVAAFVVEAAVQALSRRRRHVMEVVQQAPIS